MKNMNFYISNEGLDGQIAEIRLKIKLSMNGIVSDQMKEKGIEYKQNYGVSIPRIYEIAKQYSPNHDLANRLWMLGIRETMVMSILLQPIDKFSIELAKSRINELNQMELVEQFCMHLLCKVSYANEICMSCVSSEQLWPKIVGFMLAVRIYKQFDGNEISFITQNAFENSKQEEYYLFKTISLCLSRFCRINTEQLGIIERELELWGGNVSASQQYIKEEVKQEIKFLIN